MRAPCSRTGSHLGRFQAERQGQILESLFARPKGLDLPPHTQAYTPTCTAHTYTHTRTCAHTDCSHPEPLAVLPTTQAPSCPLAFAQAVPSAGIVTIPSPWQAPRRVRLEVLPLSALGCHHPSQCASSQDLVFHEDFTPLADFCSASAEVPRVSTP